MRAIRVIEALLDMREGRNERCSGEMQEFLKLRVGGKG